MYGCKRPGMVRSSSACWWCPCSAGGIYLNNAAAWVRVGLSLAAAVVIVRFIVSFRNSKVPADRASGRCLRLMGLIHGQEVDGGSEGVDSYYLVVADVGRYRTYNPRLIRQLRDPAWRSMDMSKHTNVVFEVRDEHGAVVYRDPRYHPDDANEGVRAYSDRTVHAPIPVMPPQGGVPGPSDARADPFAPVSPSETLLTKQYVRVRAGMHGHPEYAVDTLAIVRRILLLFSIAIVI